MSHGWNCTPFQRKFIFLCPLNSWQPPLYSLVSEFDCFRNSFKWNQKQFVCVFLCCKDWLISRGIMSSGFIHVAANGRIPFIFQGECKSTECTYHPFFMHSPVPGHRGCFSRSVLLWATQQWSGPCTYLLQLLISFPWDVDPKVRWVCRRVVLFVILGGTSMLFSTMTAPFCMPTNSVERIQCVHILANTLSFLLLNNTV